MKYIRLEFSNWQRVRFWKRYYIFSPNTEYVNCYYVTYKGGMDQHDIEPFKAGRAELVFDLWKKEILDNPSMISMASSNKRVSQPFKFKYEFTFNRKAEIVEWYLSGERITLEYSQYVVPGVTYILNTLYNTLETK